VLVRPSLVFKIKTTSSSSTEEDWHSTVSLCYKGPLFWIILLND